MKIKVILMACLGCWLASFHASAQDFQRVAKEKQFTPINSSELIRRYPQGKKWRSISVFRGTGTGSSTNWILTGDVNVVLNNRYVTETEVVKQEERGNLAHLTLRCKILEASATKVFSKKRLRLADFDTDDPLFDLGMDALIEIGDNVAPGFKLARRAGKIILGADPKLERTLTSVARKLNLEPDALTGLNDLQLIEAPDQFVGRVLEVRWVNGLGVTELREVRNPKLTPLDTSELQRWAQGADPLADLYIFPSLTKRTGDKWTLDASRASSVFVGRGDADTRGNIQLRYASDGSYDSDDVRQLRIDAGNLDATIVDDGSAITLSVDSMTGDFSVARSDGMLLMANGRAKLTYDRISTDHILFKARLSRDFRSEWRYEAKRLDP